MVGGVDEPTFPNCCAECPHLETVSAACTHELRQAFIREIGLYRPCPGYRR